MAEQEARGIAQDVLGLWIFDAALVLWTGFGLLVLAIAAAFALRKWRRWNGAEHLSGTIVSYRAAADAEGGENFYPVVRGTRPTGESFEFESPVYRMRPDPPAGSQVVVLVDPERPERLFIAGHQWHWYTLPVMVGGFFFLSGVALMVAMKFARWLWP
jgi:Protein of unknown function (DUF3592)